MRQFDQSFIYSGLTVAKDGTKANQVNLSAGKVYFYVDDAVIEFSPQSFTTSAKSATYYLVAVPNGTISFDTTLVTKAGSVEVATVATDASGNVSTVTANTSATTATLYPNSNVQVSGASSSASPIVPVLNQSCICNYGQTVTAQATYWKQYVALVDASDLQIIYENTNQYEGINTANQSTLQVQSAIEINGTAYQVSFNGQYIGKMDPGMTITSDPIGIEITAGSNIRIRTYVDPGSSSGAVPSTFHSNSTNNEGYLAGNQLFSTASPNTFTTGWMYSPSLIVGRPRVSGQPSIVLVGDSIMNGSNQTQNYGFCDQALTTKNYSYNNISCSGEEADQWATQPFARKVRTAQIRVFGGTHAIVNYGTNDIVKNSATASQLESDLQTVWSTLKKNGIKKVYQCTLLPRVTSSDSFATVANQTPVAGFENGGVRDTVNTWIRSVPSGLDGVIDISPIIEASGDHTRWNLTYVSDGTHPNDAGHTAMSNYLQSLPLSSMFS